MLVVATKLGGDPQRSELQTVESGSNSVEVKPLLSSSDSGYFHSSCFRLFSAVNAAGHVSNVACAQRTTPFHSVEQFRSEGIPGILCHFM